MKKLSFFAFAACAILSPLTLSAQKKNAKSVSKTPAHKIVPAKPVLKTEADTISYALGINMVQSGLKGYLTQMGVITETDAIESNFNTKIESETDEAKKAKLSAELKFKLDSINKANSTNIEEFIAGFTQSMGGSQTKSAFNTGVAIGTQLSNVTEKFSKEVLGEDGKFNAPAFIAGFSNSLKEEELLINNAEELMQNASQKAQQAQEAKKAEEMKVEYAAQIAEGDRFMAENKIKKDVVTLPSGLQYKIITKGTGEMPTATDRVTVHYKGTLLDGTVFDSSIERGEPATFGVTQVIKGWTEALQLMPEGSKWILYIPYDLAYGSREQGSIKPFSNLIFEIELIKVEK